MICGLYSKISRRTKAKDSKRLSRNRRLKETSQSWRHGWMRSSMPWRSRSTGETWEVSRIWSRSTTCWRKTSWITRSECVTCCSRRTSSRKRDTSRRKRLVNELLMWLTGWQQYALRAHILYMFPPNSNLSGRFVVFCIFAIFIDFINKNYLFITWKCDERS